MKLIPVTYVLLISLAMVSARAGDTGGGTIPLPEHPRPDFERSSWVNLNGEWQFRFDPQNIGLSQAWFQTGLRGTQSILVPFSWGSSLSGVADRADIAWYERRVKAPEDWKSRRVFLVVGASDWRTSVWLDGHKLGVHRGGYNPFEFNLTPHLNFGQAQRLVIRVDDAARPFKLEGKQGYGEAKGIWQTPYLEARGDAPLKAIHFSPDLEKDSVTVEAYLREPAPQTLTLRLDFESPKLASVSRSVAQGVDQVTFDIPIADPHLWSLNDPFLYEVDVTVTGHDLTPDQVHTYFGMRSISVVDLPGTNYPYIALNGRPVYLQLALDQAYHPEGFYTLPTDEFVRDEVLRAKQIGLNGMRVHVKIPLPRKLYWADRLGFLIMADVPNSWGEPTPAMFREHAYAMRRMIARDYNHPSVFSWILFNESWGLKTDPEGEEEYLSKTQEQVVQLVRTARKLDPTRLVEDNSVCCQYGHTVTDINSWHMYNAGYEISKVLDEIVENTYPGSTFNFEDGYQQKDQPLINSEFGNVWGYEGSTGDVDWSWDYHIFMNEFRKRPKIAGWLYTQHHDVINEWNGYWRYDRSGKKTGLDSLFRGMSLNDLHSPLYVAVGDEMSKTVHPGEMAKVPIWASFLTGSRAYGEKLFLEGKLYGWNTLGRKEAYGRVTRSITYHPWMSRELDPFQVRMPEQPGLVIFATALKDAAGSVLQRNFTTFVVEGDMPSQMRLGSGAAVHVVRTNPADFSESRWSLKQWDVLEGLKVNGAGAGYFAYTIPWPKSLKFDDVESATFMMEASAKKLLGKDRVGANQPAGAWMLGEGTFDPGLVPNSYPMTDEDMFPSAVTVSFNGTVAEQVQLRDDPADHRGILSWHSQLRNDLLQEAGSYGYLVNVAIPRTSLKEAAQAGELIVRLKVSEALAGGLAIYGEKFGRYPLNPTVVFSLKDPSPESATRRTSALNSYLSKGQ